MLTEHEAEHVKRPFRYVPPFPDRSGYHWIRRYRGAPCIPLHWFADWHRNGNEGWGQWAEPDREDQWEYNGPCPSPSDPAGSDWIQAGGETIGENKDAVIRRLGTECNSLRATLGAVDYTLAAHGKIDANTPLHDRIRDALSND